MIKKFRRVFVTLLVIAVALPVVSTRADQQSRGENWLEAGAGNYEDRAVQIIAEREGVPQNRLFVGDIVKKKLSNTGVEYIKVKVVDQKTGTAYGVSFDLEGSVIEDQQMVSAERDAANSPQGRIHPDLKPLIEDMDENASIMVSIWLKTPDLQVPDRPDRGEDLDQARLDAYEDSVRDSLSSQMDLVQAPVLDALSQMGREPASVSPIAPLLYVELTAAEIDAVAERPDVDMIYGPNENQDVMDVAKETHKAHFVDMYYGIDGSGVDLAILEDSRIEFSNPYLNSGTTRVPGDGNVDDHATATGGMAASQHTAYQGIARGVNLFSANATDYTDANLSAAMDWAESEGVDIINNSWGSGSGTGLNEHARHLDYIARYSIDTITISAGNDGNTTEYVGNPGRAYNAITVGAYDDQGTVTWEDDVMASYSSWKDPDTGAAKPEVVGSGSSITSTTMSNPWIGNVGSGTSYSAPQVAGEAALIINADPLLSAYPEALKALVMATALHNIEGDSEFSEYDGAGGVDMRRAVRLAVDGTYHTASKSSSDFPYSVDYDLKKGEKVRAVIAWFSNPDSSYTSDPLEADLDLRVYDPSGSFVTSSTSFDNPFEIVEFTVPYAGTYSFKVSAFRFDGSSEFVGLAVWTGDRKTRADFDGDDSADISVYRPSNGNWYVRGQGYQFWGNPGDLPVPGDYDGDGDTELAVYRPSNGKWYIKGLGNYKWGQPDDVPMPCDFNGDGVTDIAVYRPSIGNWYIRGQGYQSWGLPGDIPVPRDYDGDGSCDIAIFRPSNGKWYVIGDSPVKWGSTDDIPVPADYDGDGDADIAVYRPSNGNWYIDGQGYQSWGYAGDKPVPADYDGDGVVEIAVLRKSNGKWYINGMGNYSWYSSGDYPLPVRDTNADGDIYH